MCDEAEVEVEISPEDFSAAVVVCSRNNGMTLLESMAETCGELNIHEDDVKDYITPELNSHLYAECLNNNLLKERMTTKRIF